MRKSNSKTHREKIRSHLRRGWGIDTEIARKRYGCHSLAQRIYELKKEGEKIIKTMRLRYGIRFAWYKMKV